jgi:hypothetical protein
MPAACGAQLPPKRPDTAFHIIPQPASFFHRPFNACQPTRNDEQTFPRKKMIGYLYVWLRLVCS